MSYEHADTYHRIETVENYSDIYSAVESYIGSNFDKRVGIADFVKTSGYSQRQTQRALSYHDTNWQRMLLDRRMRRAKELLQHSGETVGSVAAMVGYDHSQFSRTFKSEEGMGPEEYRTWIRQQ